MANKKSSKGKKNNKKTAKNTVKETKGKQIELYESQEIESPVALILAIIVLVVLLVFSLFKMGTFGLVVNNIFSYLLSDLYIVPILSIIIYIIIKLYKKKRVIKSLIGLLFISLATSLILSLTYGEITSIDTYLPLLTNLDAIITEGSSFHGGIIGELIYVGLYSILNSTAIIIIIVALFIASIFLLIPWDTIKEISSKSKDAVVSTKDVLVEKHEEFRQRIQERKDEEAFLELNGKKDDLKENETPVDPELQDVDMYDDENYETIENKLLDKTEKEIEIENQLKEEPVTIEPVVEPIKEVSPNKADIENSDAYFNAASMYSDKKVENNGSFNNSNEYLNVTGEKEEIHNEMEPAIEKVINEDGTTTVTITRELENKEYKVKAKGNRKYHNASENNLEESVSSSSTLNTRSAEIKGKKLIEVLANFGVSAELSAYYVGPSVTKFEIKPDSNVKIEKIKNLQDNLQMELKAKTIRIEAPVPGKNVVGVEIPNVKSEIVKMKDIIKVLPKEAKIENLSFALGKDLFGAPVKCDLTKMPHLLVAGATGSGKSVCINTIICSFLLRYHPNDLKLVLIDPKKVEFTPYHDIPHLLWPVITDVRESSLLLTRMCQIMEERYEVFSKAGVRNIISYNELVDEENSKKDASEVKLSKLPYIVVIIDELADLMMTNGKEVEASIQRLTQLARACGIHMIVATQRPSTDVITGIIKSNIPSRISFAVASQIDSRTIIDQPGAERLLGYGDMLYFPTGEASPIRIQGAFISDEEIRKITDEVKSYALPTYDDSYYAIKNGQTNSDSSNPNTSNNGKDELWDQIIDYITATQKCSTSLLQRKFGIGFNRSARIIDQLEEEGYIGPQNGSKPREVYVKNNPE